MHQTLTTYINVTSVYKNDMKYGQDGDVHLARVHRQQE